LDTCDNRDVYKLPTPIRKEEALSTIRLLLQFGHRIEKVLRPRRSSADQELIDRAKQLMMEREGYSEEEAHHALQRRSMDAGARLSQTARLVIEELRNDPA
jgi:response regulator NasT